MRRGTAAVCTHVAVMPVMLCAAVTKASRWPRTRRTVKVKASDSSSEGPSHLERVQLRCHGKYYRVSHLLDPLFPKFLKKFLSHGVRTVEALSLII